MRNRKRTGFATLFLFLLLLFLYFSAITVASAVSAVVVSDVKGLGDYVPRGHSFTHGDTLKVYVEMQAVNHGRFVSVDFAFIIEDQRGNVVATDTMKVERKDYHAEDVYVVYTKQIPDEWLCGRYELDIYAYDRVDDMKVREAKQSIIKSDKGEKLIEGGGSKFVVDFKDVTVPISDSRKEKAHIIFYVHPEEIMEKLKPEEIIKPRMPKPEEVKRPIFKVTDVGIDKFKVKPDELVSISVTVENRGIRGTENVTLVINGKKEAEESVTLSSMESKTIVFHVTKTLPGTYKVTIPGTDIVRLFFVEESPSSGNSTLSEAEAKAPSSGESLQNYGITTAFGATGAIAISVLIILYLRKNII